MRRDLCTGVRRAAVQPDARATGGPVGGDHAGVWAEPVGRVLGGDPALQRGTPHTDAVLRQAQVRESLTRRDAQLRLHQVDVGDLLGHGVLDLDAGVHLDEHVAPGRVDQELHRARVDVADLLGEPHRVGADPIPQRRGEVGGRRDLDHLLVPTLHRAVPLEQVDHVARTVGQDLHLDVARVHHRLLDEHGRVAEGTLRLAHARPNRLTERLGRVDPPHTATTSTRHRLDEQRERQLRGRRDQGVGVRRRLNRPQGRDPGRPRRRDRPRLVAGQREDLGRRPHEGDPGSHACLRQGGVLRQEPITRVDRVGTGTHRRVDDGLRIQVGPHRVPALTDLVRLVRLQPMLRPPVLVREHGHRVRTQLVRRAKGPHRDLATVRDQQLPEHPRPFLQVK